MPWREILSKIRRQPVVFELQNNHSFFYFRHGKAFVPLCLSSKMANDQLRILLVDDNRQFIERMICMLSELNIIQEINVASSYEEAVDILNSQMPDLALLDIHLPGKNGIELLKMIKLSGRPCQVMMLTNQADEYYRNLCFKLGADHFLDKTNDFLLIPDIIRNMKTS